MTASRPPQASVIPISGRSKPVRGRQRAGKIARSLGVRLPRPDGDLVLFFPTIIKQHEKVRFAAEIPTIEERRAGLDADLRLWIILDEFNTDIVGRSFYIEIEPPIGRFQGVLPSLLREFIARVQIEPGKFGPANVAGGAGLHPRPGGTTLGVAAPLL